MPLRVAVAGANGQLGSALVRAFTDAGYQVEPLARPDWDMQQQGDRERVMGLWPDLVVNAAAWTDVDGCARDPQRAVHVNGHAAGALAAVAGRANAFFVQISTNEVFDGMQQRPYVETDEPNPMNEYGGSKLLGEQLVAAGTSRYLIVRTAWVYGGPRSFPVKIRAAAVDAIAADRPLRVVADELGNPTPAAALADAIVELRPGTNDEAVGILNIAGEPPISRFGWAREALANSPVRLEAIPLREYRRSSIPPLRAVLDMRRAHDLGLAPILWRKSPG